MSDKEIKIKFTSTANIKGAEETIESIEETAVAAKKAGAAVGSGFSDVDEVIAKLDEKFKAAQQSLDDLNKTASGLGENLDDAADGAEGMSQEVEKIGRMQRVQTVHMLSSGIQELGSRMAIASKEISEFDPELGKTIETMGEVASAAGTMGTAIATGLMAGPWGAAAGAIAASIGIVIGKFTEAGQESAAFAAQLESDLEKMREKSAEVAAAQNELEWDKFVDGIEAQTAAVQRSNVALAEQLKLTRGIKDLDLSEAESEAELRKTQIDTDPNKTPAQKTREKAAIDRETNDLRKGRAIEKIDERVADADRDVSSKRAEADRIGGDRESVTAQRIAAEERDAEFKKRKEAADRAKADRPANQKIINDGAMADWNPLLSADEQIKAQQAARDAEERIRQGNEAIAAADRDRPYAEVAAKDLADKKAKEKEFIDRENAARTAADESALKAGTVRSLADREKQLVGNRFAGKNTANSLISESAAAAQEKQARDAEEAKQKREQQKREQEEKRAASARERVDQQGAGIADQVEKSATKLSLNPAQQAVVKKGIDNLRNGGVQSGEADQMSTVINQILNLMESQGSQKPSDGVDWRAIQRKLAKLEKDQGDIKGQLRNNRAR